MEYREADKVLNRPVKFFREATEPEKGIFSDKEKGPFYIVCLASRQRFVAHFEQAGVGFRTKKKILTFRPLNHVIEGLEEVSYSFPDYLIGDIFEGSKESFKFSKNLSPKDQEILMDSLLIGHPGAMDEHPNNPPFLDKALQVAKAYFKFGPTSDKYKKTLIPEETNKTLTSIQKIKSTHSR